MWLARRPEHQSIARPAQDWFPTSSGQTIMGLAERSLKVDDEKKLGLLRRTTFEASAKMMRKKHVSGRVYVRTAPSGLIEKVHLSDPDKQKLRDTILSPKQLHTMLGCNANRIVLSKENRKPCQCICLHVPFDDRPPSEVGIHGRSGVGIWGGNPDAKISFSCERAISD